MAYIKSKQVLYYPKASAGNNQRRDELLININFNTRNSFVFSACAFSFYIQKNGFSAQESRAFGEF